MTSSPSRHVIFGVGLVALLPIALGAMALHARSARAKRAGDSVAIDAVCKQLPGSGLALSGGARWLRQPGLEEPGAPFVDGIAAPDPDPAGAAFAPPREVLR